MKRIIISFGLISGLIITGIMIYTIAMCYNKDDFEGNMVLGYASMILAFSFIFIGVKNYRDKYSNGLINFGKAFKIGFYISLVASTVYVVVWLIDYYVFIPDFMDKYTTYVLKETKADGASLAELNEKAAEMADYKELYKNPLFVVLFTYSEILPVGLLIALISALILKRKAKDQQVSTN